MSEMAQENETKLQKVGSMEMKGQAKSRSSNGGVQDPSDVINDYIAKLSF